MQSRLTPDEYDFRVFGEIVLVGAAVMLVLFVANLRAHFLHGAPNFSEGFGFLVLYCLIVGYGLMQIKKWAAVLLAAPMLISGLVMAIRTVIEKPSLWGSSLALFWAAILSLPTVMTIRRWRVLR